MSIFNNPDFYPTPLETIQRMLQGVNLLDKVVLEPSAGKGDILDYLNDIGANTVFCETSKELAQISSQKATFLHSDFLEVTPDQISHIDYLVGNPPFSKDVEHIQHAWDICPDGCTIIMLCNWESIDNTYSRSRSRLKTLIQENGTSENLGNVFSTAERKTDVEIGLVILFKPQIGESEFDGYFDMFEDAENFTENGLIPHNEVVEVVNRYIGAVKMFDEVEEASNKINSLTSPFSYNNIKFGAHRTSNDGGYHPITREAYKKSLQKSAWKTIFSKLNMEKYVTQSVLDKLNKFVEKQTNVPFKLSNVWKMIDAIYQTYEENMNLAINEIFETLTYHSHENRYEVESWKSNSHYLISRKFIMPYMTSPSHVRGMSISYNGRYKVINDLNKALCFLVGKNYNDIGDMWDLFYRNSIKDPKYYDTEERREKYAIKYERCVRDMGKASMPKKDYVDMKIKSDIEKCPDSHTFEYGKWYDWGFFEIKGYKKGTMHFKFKDESVWATLNQRIAKINNWGLPEKF